MSNHRKGILLGCLMAFAVTASLVSYGCGGGGDQEQGGLQGTVKIDGSSTVFPISEAVAEEFQKVHPGVRVTVGISGTGGGFKKFCAGETDISDASRPIKPTEVEKCGGAGIEYVELPVAFDGIAVVVNPGNDFVDVMTVDELKRLWQPESTVRTWSDIRPEWPDREIHLYGPGTDSGTYDYFTKAIVGKEHASRPDFTASEDDNILVQGISGDPDALGYFGFAYYDENRSRLKIVPIDPGDGAVTPSSSTINDGSYKPLSRPIFIYVSTAATEKPEVKAFVDFYIEHATELVPEVGYVPLPTTTYDVVKARFESKQTGSVFSGTKVGASLEDLLRSS
jgi:phosphate transport system substrate-binding protein